MATHDIICDVTPTNVAASLEWVQSMGNFEKVGGCRKRDFSETTLLISMKLIGCYNILSLIRFNLSNLSYLCACTKTKKDFFK